MIDGIDDSMAPALAAASTPVDRPVVGIIGGSGLLNLAGLEDVHRKVARTPWGQTSGALSFGRLAGVPVVFLRGMATATPLRRMTSTTGPTSGRCARPA